MADAAVYVARLGAKDETQAAFNSVQRNMNNTRKASQALNQQFRFMRGGLGQVGHQVQDIAVQLSMGTNAMLVFGQQGSQIASLFGPQGAMIGAVLAVAAAVGVSFTKDIKKGENALKDLEQSIVDTINTTGELGKTFRETLIAIYETQVENLTTKLEEQKEQQKEANAQIAEHTKLTNRAEKAEKSRLGEMGRMEDSTRAARINTKELARSTKIAAGQAEDYENRIAKLNERLKQLREGKVPTDLTDGMKKGKSAVESYVQSLERSTLSTVSGDIAAKAYELTLLDLSGAELKSAQMALKRYASALLTAQADKDAAKAAKERTAAERAAFEAALNANIAADQQRDREEKAERKRRQASIDRLRTFEEFKNEMGDTFLQMKKLEDGLVGVTENAMANFTDSFYDAISGAKSFKDAFKDMARSIVEDLSKMLIQYYITQQIFGAIVGMFPGGGGTTTSSGTTSVPAVNLNPGGYSPRAMGGSVTGGKPYLVGERGPELFVPNASGGIVANNKLGDGGVTVVQNINISTGVQQTVRAEIANLLPQISNAAKAAVADSRMRGGGFSKAMGGA